MPGNKSWACGALAAVLCGCSPAADSGAQNAFVGNFGYIVTYPPGYSARAGWGDKAKTDEIVDFYPGKTAPESSDAPGLVRLEARPVLGASGQPIGLDELLRNMSAAMQRYGETYSVSAATATLPAMKVAISDPKTPAKLYQVALRGKFVLYMFSSHDEALADAFASNLSEVQPTDRPGR